MRLAEVEELLRSTAAPYVIPLLREDAGLVGRLEASGMSVIQLDGGAMRTLPSVFMRLGDAFRFPSQVVNYGAFEDWMRDLDWLDMPSSGWVVIVRHARHLMAGDGSQRDVLLGALADIGADWGKPVSQGGYWDRPAIPFHTLLIG